MQKCAVCGGTCFYKESGYFFCETCQTQSQEVREEVFDLRVDTTTRIRKTKIRQLRIDRSNENLGWTSWELYNFILIGLTNELIELGVSPSIKLTILQLWATYLGKIEVAFISTKKRNMPKLARRYRKRDAEIIYGKVQSEKRYKRRKRTTSSTNTSIISGGQSEGSSMRELNKNKRLLVNADYDRYLQSQASSGGDSLSLFNQSAHSVYSAASSSVNSVATEGKVKFSSHAKEEARKIKRLSKNLPRCERIKYRSKHITSQYRMSPHIITPMRLWAIIYLALRIHNESIHLGDMLRYGREGHLSYYKLDHLLPPEVSLTPKERSYLTQNVAITHRGMRRMITSMAKFLDVWNIVSPDLISLVNRYCLELGLPRGIQLYAGRLIALSPPKMVFDRKVSYIPNYEGRAMAFIIVVLKTLLGLDGITEYQISHVAEKINSVAVDRGLLNEKLFNFQEWQKYMECRKTVLVHAHIPTRLKYSPDTYGIDDLYIKFLEFIASKSTNEQSNEKNSKHFLPEELVDAMTRHVISLDVDDVSSKPTDIFPPSLTPLHSYLECLMENPLHDVPRIAQSNFYLTKVGYMTKPNALIELAKQCDITLEVIKSNLHFLEKLVPPFEQPRMPSVEELKELVDVQDNPKIQYVNENEDLLQYLHAKVPCILKLDTVKKQYYTDASSAKKNKGAADIKDDFTFIGTLPNGRLDIPTDSDNESEEEGEKDSDYTSNSDGETILLGNKFCARHNLRLSCAEKKSIYKLDPLKDVHFTKLKFQPERNSKGQFVKGNTAVAMTGKIRPNIVAVEKEETYTSTQRNIENEIHNVSIDAVEKTLHELDDISISDLVLNNTDIKNGFVDLDKYLNLGDISFFTDFNDTLVPEDSKNKTTLQETGRFFSPSGDYWMYHCISSRVKSKNFAVFRKALPASFRWLLNECALISEMTTEDLYDEVSLIETYHSQISPPGVKSDSRDDKDSLSKNQLNFILSKW